MGWEKPQFTELEKAIESMKEVARISAEQDIEKLKQITKVYEALEKRNQEPDGMEKDQRSSTSI